MCRGSESSLRKEEGTDVVVVTDGAQRSAKLRPVAYRAEFPLSPSGQPENSCSWPLATKNYPLTSRRFLNKF